MARPELRIRWSTALARIRESIRTGRAASGLVAGALLGMVFAELGLGALLRWDFSVHDVFILAVLGAVGGSLGRLLWLLWIVDAVLLALMFVVALTPAIAGLTTRWVRADSLPSDGVDAIVVLSSSVTSSGTLHVSASDRLLAGLELVRGGVAPRLITTRVSRSKSKVTSDADQRRLISLAGVADRWILVGDSVASTHDEALAIAPRLRELGARNIAVVTSPTHTRRACATFERLGMRVTCVPALERGDQTSRPKFGGDRLAAFRAYVYERAGWWVYRRRGWVNGG